MNNYMRVVYVGRNIKMSKKIDGFFWGAMIMTLIWEFSYILLPEFFNFIVPLLSFPLVIIIYILMMMEKK